MMQPIRHFSRRDHSNNLLMHVSVIRIQHLSSALHLPTLRNNTKGIQVETRISLALKMHIYKVLMTKFEVPPTHNKLMTFIIKKQRMQGQHIVGAALSLQLLVTSVFCWNIQYMQSSVGPEFKTPLTLRDSCCIPVKHFRIVVPQRASHNGSCKTEHHSN